MKLLYLTVIPSPFQLEFLDNCSNYLEGKGNMVAIFEKSSFNYRTHWGENDSSQRTILKKNKSKDLLRILKEVNPDVLIFTQYNSKYTLLGIIWSILKKRPYFIGPLEIFNVYNKSIVPKSFKLNFFRIITRKAKGIAAMGNNATRLYAKVFNGPIINIPYSFDLSKLLENKPLISSKDPIIFIFSGRLEPFRNPQLAIELFAEVTKENPDKPLKLVISGKGSLYNECITLIQSLKIENKVEWQNDFKDWYDIQNLYSMGHVLLALQIYSTWGLIIQEAMAAGLGIIATRTIEAADNLILNGYNGFLVSLHRQEIKSKMEEYINNPDRIILHGKRSKEIVQNVDVKPCSKNFIDFVLKNYARE